METLLQDCIVVACDCVQDNRGIYSPRAVAGCDLHGENECVYTELLLNAKPAFPLQWERRVVVAFEAMEAMECFSELGWPPPLKLVDLRHELHNQTNGITRPGRADLAEALVSLGLECLEVIIGQLSPPFARKCAGRYALARAVGTSRVLRRLLPRLSNHALLRGEYAKARALMHLRGIPIDVDAHQFLIRNKTRLLRHFIENRPEVAQFYEEEVFKRGRVAAAVSTSSHSWPQTETGLPKITDRVLAARAGFAPWVTPLREVQKIRNAIQSYNLAVGSDGRSRSTLTPGWTITGRDKNSSTREIFGLPRCFRRLVKPGPAMAAGNVDYATQDFGSAAALSDDPQMLNAYRSEDPYLQLAILSGIVPEDATRRTHPRERSHFKVISLGVLYGMGAEQMGIRAGITESEASRLLEFHKMHFRKFWKWSKSVTDFGQLSGHLHSPFGGRLHVTEEISERTLRNYPIQSAGSDMLHLACVELMKQGVGVCATAHDAVLIEAPGDEIEDQVAVVRRVMEDSSEIVLVNLRLKTEAEIFHYPDSLHDPQGDEVLGQLQCAARELGGRL